MKSKNETKIQVQKLPRQLQNNLRLIHTNTYLQQNGHEQSPEPIQVKRRRQRRKGRLFQIGIVWQRKEDWWRDEEQSENCKECSPALEEYPGEQVDQFLSQGSTVQRGSGPYSGKTGPAVWQHLTTAGGSGHGGERWLLATLSCSFSGRTCLRSIPHQTALQNSRFGRTNAMKNHLMTDGERRCWYPSYSQISDIVQVFFIFRNSFLPILWPW